MKVIAKPVTTRIIKVKQTAPSGGGAVSPETGDTIRAKLGIATLSGANTGDNAPNSSSAPALTADQNYVTATEKANLHAPGSDAETVTTLGALINGTGSIGTPADVDKFPLRDSAGGLLAHITWANIKAALTTAFSAVYEPIRTYTGNVIGAGVSLLNAIAALDAALTVTTYPATTIEPIGNWTLDSTDVSRLAALGGLTITATEPAGGAAANGGIRITAASVAAFNKTHWHYRYFATNGSTSGHTAFWQIRKSDGSYQTIIPSAELDRASSLVSFNFQTDDPTAYLYNGAVVLEFIHTSNGSDLHRVELDHFAVTDGINTGDPAMSHPILSGRSLDNQHTMNATTGLVPIIGDASGTITAVNAATITLSMASRRSFDIDASALAAGNSFTVAITNVPVRAAIDLTLAIGANVPSVTWPTGVTAPALAANKEYWISLGTRNSGTTWRALGSVGF